MQLKVHQFDDVTWIDIAPPTEEALDELQQRYPQFHPLAIEDCLSQLERPKIDNYDDHLFVVMQFPEWNEEKQIEQPMELDLFVGDSFLVTVHHNQSASLSKLWHESTDKTIPSHTFSKGVELLYELMDRMIDAQFPMMQMFEYKVRALERNIFSERAADVVQKLALIRRDLITLQRIIRPQVLVLTELEQTNHHFFPDDIDDYFGDLTDHLSTIQDIIDENTEVIESLVDTVSTLSSIRINEVMRILTVISVIMLPLTLVAGIYGMNVPLPFQKTAYSFWVIMGSMLLISIGMLGFFSHKKWL